MSYLQRTFTLVSTLSLLILLTACGESHLGGDAASPGPDGAVDGGGGGTDGDVPDTGGGIVTDGGVVDATGPDTGGGITDGAVIEAKGRTYPIEDLLDGMGAGMDLEGGHQVTLYLGPKDYHRIHCPIDADLVESRHVPGERFSVQPRVLARHRVLPVNERVVCRLESEHGTFFMVLVGAMIVGRIRVVGVDPLHRGPIEPPRHFVRGEEFGRFEMGSTVVLLTPRGFLSPLPSATEGETVRMGQAIARLGEQATS